VGAVIPAALLACAPNVAPATLEAIVRVESNGDPIAINVNHLASAHPRANTTQEVVAIARQFIAAGYNVDLGLMQINSRNLPALGYTLEDAFDPCRNIAGGAAILTSFYGSAVLRFGEGQAALQASLRAYNTGSFYRGDAYLARYDVPAIPLGSSIQKAAPARSAPADPWSANTVAYSREDLHVRID
jgi:type IV secretion system protein VirB1